MITHLAIVMDGNRRWAKKQLLTPWKGHQEGVEAAQKTIEFCLKKNIKFLSLYTFSIENFNRSTEEKNFLFEILARQVYNRVSELIDQGVRVRFIGDRTLFPTNLIEVIDDVERQTQQLNNLQVNVLFCYGGQQEIAQACKLIAQKVKAGLFQEDQITPQIVSDHLWTAGIPDPELIIRTGGRKRLSNFLLFQAAYSELYFLDCLWPDITERDLENAVNYYANITRNFGT